MLGNPILVKGLLEKLVVAYVFIALLGIPIDLVHLDGSRVHCINDLAVDSSSGALLNLGYIQLAK